MHLPSHPEEQRAIREASVEKKNNRCRDGGDRQLWRIAAIERRRWVERIALQSKRAAIVSESCGPKENAQESLLLLL